MHCVVIPGRAKRKPGMTKGEAGKAGKATTLRRHLGQKPPRKSP